MVSKMKMVKYKTDVDSTTPAVNDNGIIFEHIGILIGSAWDGSMWLLSIISLSRLYSILSTL